MEPDINQRYWRDTTQYDRSGNTVWQTTIPLIGGGPPTVTERAAFYGHDGTLRAVDSRSRSWAVGKLTSTFEEYRYDALGRRVLVLTRKYCDPTGERPLECNLDVVRRTVWDGSQELYEIQMPLGTSQDPENDVAIVDLPAQQEPNGSGNWYDVNAHFGRVVYTHALGLDQPHSIVRIGYVSRVSTGQAAAPTGVPFAPFTIVPFWEIGGQVASGMYADIGRADRCQTVSGRTHCVYLQWPARYLGYERQTGSFAFWHGTLLLDKRDAAGLSYRRNRYYDPATGRFTQEDPIGLAGGLNVYGFAGGDPVNHSDPFGLFATSCCVLPLPGVLPPPPIPQEVTNAAARAAESAAAAVSDAVDALRDKIQYRVVTYTRTAPDGQVYSGRTSGFGDPQSIVEARARSHPERLSGFGPSVYDKWAPWSPQAYLAIRGREQQLIDAHGGAQSEGGTSANIRRGVNRAASPIAEAAATAMFGPPPSPQP